MKKTSTTRAKAYVKFQVVLLVASLMLFANTTFAHRVISYTPPCVLAGQTVTVKVIVTAADFTTWYHWQYRVNVPGSAPGPWIFLDGNASGTPVNNTINGTVFAVSNANRLSNIDDFAYDLIIANATTALNNIEIRVLMGAGADPQIVTSPVWNGEDQATTEAKKIHINVKPGNENCFTNCTDNALVLNPPATAATPVEDFYGGFESGTANFGIANADGSSVSAQTDYTQWTTGFPSSNFYGVINNPDTMIYLATPFAPHSGRQMLVINESDNTTDKFWYKAVVAPTSPVQNYFNGPLSFKVWVSKVEVGANPSFAIVLKGTNGADVTSTLTTVPVTMTIIPGQPGFDAGDWVQYSLNYIVPPNTYKKLEISMRGNSTTANSFAIDDICLLVPAAGVVPLTLTPLKAVYTNGITHLSWSTEQESNTASFVIEHSTDAVHFSSIGSVSAAGFSNNRVNYKFSDNQTKAGLNYYRVKAVDKDGQFKLSNIANVNVIIKGLFVTGVYPSPFTDKINISILSESSLMATVRLFDYTGKQIAAQNTAVIKGITKFSLDNLANLARGIYMVQVQVGETVLTQKLIK
ncbi:MAG: T9SS type A sorting domain-containing protein [Ferruginibacter sp.]